MLSLHGAEISEGCLSDLTLDEWSAGELGAHEEVLAEQHVQECDRCSNRRQELSLAAERFLRKYPLPVSNGSSDPPQSVVHKTRRTPARRWVEGGAVLAAAAVLFLFLQASEEGFGWGHSHDNLGVRLKGSSRLAFFIKRGTEVFRGHDQDGVYAGDRLRFVITTFEPQHVAVYSRDASGRAAVVHPQTAAAEPFGVVREAPFSSSVELDGTLGQEEIWGVFCNEAFQVEPLRHQLEEYGRLEAFSGCTFEQIGLFKRGRP